MIKIKSDLFSVRQQIIDYCLSLPDAYEDYPFHDPNWCVVRHKGTKKVFAWIFEKDDYIWVNIKCDPDWIQFWRDTYNSVVPAFHLNKEHWNSVILDGSIPEKEIQLMIGNSYDLTLKEVAKKVKAKVARYGNKG